MKKFETIELAAHDGIAVLKFNRPGQLNAMNRQMMDEIIDALESITNNQPVSVGIITGAGRAFMAGADIKEYAAQTDEQFKDFQHRGSRLYDLIEKADIPFIAAVNGFALGGGFEIALACDMIVASESAKLGLPEVHLGLIPGGGGTQRLLHKLGMNRAKEILMLGQSIPAAQLYNWGLVNILCAENDFEDTVKQLAEKLKRRPSGSLSAIKKLLRPSFIETSFEKRLADERTALADLFHTPAASELIRAFIAKNTQP